MWYGMCMTHVHPTFVDSFLSLKSFYRVLKTTTRYQIRGRSEPVTRWTELPNRPSMTRFPLKSGRIPMLTSIQVPHYGSST